MSRRNETLQTEYDIVTNQMYRFGSLDNDIDIINIVGKMQISVLEVGTNTEHLKYKNYKEHFDKMHENEDYSLSLLDDSMIILKYVFNENGEIKSHNLSFVPSYRQDLFRDQDKEEEGWEESEQQDANISEEQYCKRLSNYIRIDYDVEGRQEFYHTLVHMHIGVFEYSVRLPLETAIYPNDFLYFIFKYIYHIDEDKLTKLDCPFKKNKMLTEKELLKFRMVYGE